MEIKPGYISFIVVVGNEQQGEKAGGTTLLDGLAVGGKLYAKDMETEELYVFEVIEKITEE